MLPPRGAVLSELDALGHLQAADEYADYKLHFSKGLKALSKLLLHLLGLHVACGKGWGGGISTKY